MDDLVDRIDKLMGGSSDAEQTGIHRHNVTSLLSALSTTSIPTVNLNLFCRQSTIPSSALSRKASIVL